MANTEEQRIRDSARIAAAQERITEAERDQLDIASQLNRNKSQEEVLNNKIIDQKKLLVDIAKKLVESEEDQNTEAVDYYKKQLQQETIGKKLLANQLKITKTLKSNKGLVSNVNELQKKYNKSLEMSNKLAGSLVGTTETFTAGLKKIPFLGDIFDPILTNLEDGMKKKLSNIFSGNSLKQLQSKQKELLGKLKDSGISAEELPEDLQEANKKLKIITSDAAGTAESLASSAGSASELAGGMAGAESAGAGLLAGIGGITLGIGAAVAAIAYLVKKFNDVRDAAIDISREQSLTKKEAFAQMASMKQMQLDATKYGTALGTATEEMQKADEFFKSTFETSNKISDVNAQMSAYLQKNFAATAEDANGFLKATALTGQKMDKNVLMLDNMRKAFNKATGAGLRMKDLVKAVSELTETTLANFKNIPESIFKGVMYLKQFGLTFTDTAKTASSLLNIESSINSEFEASVLTGKHINLNRARELALMGKEVPMMEDIVSQLGTYDELMNMLPMQREKLAESVGMEADKMLEVAKRLQLVNALGETRIKQLDTMKTEELQKAAAEVKGMEQEAVAAELAERASIKASELTSSTMGKMSIWVDKQLAGDTESERVYKEAGYKNTFTETPAASPQTTNTSTAAPIQTYDTLIRPGQPPIKFAEGDIILAGTELFSGNNSGGSSNTSNNSRLESLIEKLIAAVNQPVQIVMGGRVIDELDTRTTLRKTYNTSVDQGYGVFG